VIGLANCTKNTCPAQIMELSPLAKTSTDNSADPATIGCLLANASDIGITLFAWNCGGC
jgi:hypothetical protein